jgi:hypothetical protein
MDFETLSTPEIAGSFIVLVLVGMAVMRVIDHIAWELRERFGPKPKPQKWQIQFYGPDGHPMRGYRVEREEYNRLMNMVHHGQKYEEI